MTDTGRTERCLCGGRITALPEQITQQVRRHQWTPQHQIWSARGGCWGPSGVGMPEAAGAKGAASR